MARAGTMSGREERAKRIEAYVFEGKTLKEIADLEGLPESGVTTMCTKFGIKGLIRGYSGTKYVPIGCRTAAALKVSAQLSRRLKEIYASTGEDGYETARLTGVSKNVISKAIANNKTAHDWSLSQMARMAEALNMDLVDLLEWVTKEIRDFEKVGF